jgi:hypothetical protein
MPAPAAKSQVLTSFGFLESFRQTFGGFHFWHATLLDFPKAGVCHRYI